MFFDLTSGALLASLAVILVFAGVSWAIGWVVSHRD